MISGGRHRSEAVHVRACPASKKCVSPKMRVFRRLCLIAGLVLTGPALADDFSIIVDVRLTPAAAAELAKSHEGITGSASWEGEPNASGQKHVDETGRISIGQEEQTRDGAGLLRFAGKLDPVALGRSTRNIDVNVNVFSARKTHADNILDCDIVDGPADQISGRTFPILCSLITENRTSQTRP